MEQKTDIVVITALGLELAAVLAHLENPTQSTEHPQGTVYVKGTFSDGHKRWNVSVVQMGQGNPRASFETERAITFFKPRYAFFIGVAGGIKDVKLGDVVAATKVYYYEPGKAEGEFKARPDFGMSAYRLIKHSQAVQNDAKWQYRIIGQVSSDLDERVPGSFVGPIAAGEQVVASTQSPTYAFLTTNFSDALAVETEGFGFFAAVHANHPVQGLDVRGISDMVDKKGESDAAGSQPVAAHNAAAFAFEVIASLDTEIVIPDEVWDNVRGLATQLYPKGPDEQNIWERAGGDLGTLNLTLPGNTSWYSAVKLLKQGGGGAITVERLAHVMSQDFPQNRQLKAFRESVHM
jgi:adenosylhomocysteine nucleosidase